MAGRNLNAIILIVIYLRMQNKCVFAKEHSEHIRMYFIHSHQIDLFIFFLSPLPAGSMCLLLLRFLALEVVANA